MLNLAGIIKESIVDGPGLRTVLFGQGCPHHCKGCHNPETWEFGCGTDISEEEIIEIVKSSRLSRGVTFSGGEPFAQAIGFAKLAQMLKEAGYEVATYSGYTYEQLICGTKEQQELLKNIDILIDGPFRLEERTLEVAFRGSRNQRIIDVQASLEAERVVEVVGGRWQGEY